ncbi:hypothetical protein BaRGS_00000074 [Batillaria attramentaria]|uniref:Uncharacterized protein n=1 Tax=Batillaria attramentaria TaxID=370345 RepID=A0ABD0M9G9_9CAEN
MRSVPAEDNVKRKTDCGGWVARLTLSCVPVNLDSCLWFEVKLPAMLALLRLFWLVSQPGWPRNWLHGKPIQGSCGLTGGALRLCQVLIRKLPCGRYRFLLDAKGCA